MFKLVFISHPAPLYSLFCSTWSVVCTATAAPKLLLTPFPTLFQVRRFLGLGPSSIQLQQSSLTLPSSWDLSFASFTLIFQFFTLIKSISSWLSAPSILVSRSSSLARHEIQILSTRNLDERFSCLWITRRSEIERFFVSQRHFCGMFVGSLMALLLLGLVSSRFKEKTRLDCRYLPRAGDFKSPHYHPASRCTRGNDVCRLLQGPSKKQDRP